LPGHLQESSKSLRLESLERESDMETTNGIDRRSKLLQRPPVTAVACSQLVRRFRSLAARWIVRKRRRRPLGPGLENGIHQGPSSLHAVRAIEKRRITSDAIIDQRSVRIARTASERLLIPKVHLHRTNLHMSARRFRPK